MKAMTEQVPSPYVYIDLRNAQLDETSQTYDVTQRKIQKETTLKVIV